MVGPLNPCPLLLGGFWAYIGSCCGWVGLAKEASAEKVRGFWELTGQGELRGNNYPVRAQLSSSVEGSQPGCGMLGGWVSAWALRKGASRDREKRICWALPPNLCPVSPLLPCPQQEDGFCSNRGREGVSCGGGAAGCRQHHYSGEAPVLGSMGVRGGVTAPRLSISVSSP